MASERKTYFQNITEKRTNKQNAGWVKIGFTVHMENNN